MKEKKEGRKKKNVFGFGCVVKKIVLEYNFVLQMFKFGYVY